MQRYRILLRKRVGGDVVGRADYQSDDDTMALVIGAALFEICSDVAKQYELWRGDDLLAASGKIDITSLLSNLPHGHKQTVVDAAMAMRDSGWAIAKSNQLRETLKMLGRDSPLPRDHTI
jgi:hypothetical protein